METQHTNPLLCDYENGTCELPYAQNVKQEPVIDHQKKKPVQVVYFTDPICSACWGIEPQLRKLKLEYGNSINIEYHMGGLLPSWKGFNGGGISRPADVAHHWDGAGKYYEMPIDGDIWLEDPLDSSYPPSIAFMAAKMQDAGKADKFLRRIREMVFLEKKNITKWEHLEQGALAAGLDPVKFKQDYEGKASKLFFADLDFARNKGVRGFPALHFINEDGKEEMTYGYQPYQRFEQIILNLHPGVEKSRPIRNTEDAFLHFPTLTTKEFAVINDLSKNDSEKILEGLAVKGTIVKVHSKNGPIWKKVSNDPMTNQE